jgi:hypothetical protein
MTSQSTSPADNAELVRTGFQAFNAGDADECMAARTQPDSVQFVSAGMLVAVSCKGSGVTA